MTGFFNSDNGEWSLVIDGVRCDGSVMSGEVFIDDTLIYDREADTWARCDIAIIERGNRRRKAAMYFQTEVDVYNRRKREEAER